MQTININGKEYPINHRFTEEEKLECMPKIKGKKRVIEFYDDDPKECIIGIRYVDGDFSSLYTDGFCVAWYINTQTIRYLKCFFGGVPHGGWKEYTEDGKPQWWWYNFQNGLQHDRQLFFGRCGEDEDVKYMWHGKKVSKEEYDQLIINN